MKTSRAMLIDVTRCVGCRFCMAACAAEHGFDEAQAVDAEELSATAFTVVRQVGDWPVRSLCMHCQEPSCASACPVGALAKREDGPVVYDADRCLGCRYCMVACPFSVPRYEWDRLVPAVAKCDMCAARLDRGELPACVEACPAEAVTFGDRDELLAEARRRISAEPGVYHHRIYGESEAGGTSVLFLSPVAFEELGFRADLSSVPLPHLTATALGRVPGIVSVGGALLWGIWWITHRREEVSLAAAEAEGPRSRKEAENAH